MQNKAYVGFGAVSMGIMGSFLDPSFYIQYLGMRPEWVDMTEILRRMDQGIYESGGVSGGTYMGQNSTAKRAMIRIRQSVRIHGSRRMKSGNLS